MKIAYDPQIFLVQTYGGVSRYFCEIASRIAKEPSVQVCIMAPMHTNAYLAHMPPGILSGFRAPNMDLFQTRYGNYPRRVLRGLGSLMGNWMLHVMKPDIVHETYFSPYRLGGAAFATRLNDSTTLFCMRSFHRVSRTQRKPLDTRRWQLNGQIMSYVFPSLRGVMRLKFSDCTLIKPR